MIVPKPMRISARLMAALTLDGVGTFEVSESGEWRIEDADGNELQTGSDLHCPMARDYGEIMAALLGFIGADAESYRYRMGLSEPEDGYIFSPEVAEWAYQHSEEIGLAEYELENPEEDV